MGVFAFSRFHSQRLADVERPEVPQPTAAHAAVDDEPGAAAVALGVHHGRVALAGGRQNAVGDGDVPRHHPRAGTQLQHVQVVQVPGDVVFGVLAVVGQPPEQVALVAHQREAVPQAGARGGAVLGGLRLQPLPLPAAGLQLVEVAAVLAVLHHAPEDQQPRAVAHEAVGGAAGGDIAPHGRDEPLVGGGVVDVQLIHDALIASSEDHDELLDGDGAVPVPGAGDGPRPPHHPLPTRRQRGGGQRGPPARSRCRHGAAGLSPLSSRRLRAARALPLALSRCRRR